MCASLPGMAERVRPRKIENRATIIMSIDFFNWFLIITNCKRFEIVVDKYIGRLGDRIWLI